MTKKAWLLAGTAAAAAAVAVGNRRVHTVEYSVWSPKLPPEFDGYKIAQISDLHGKSFGCRNERLLDAVRRRNPDLVVLTGDITEHEPEDVPGLYRFLGQLGSEYPSVYIPGNHEQKTPRRRYARILDAMESHHIECLCDSVKVLRSGSAAVSLYGAVLPLRYYHYLYDPISRAAYFTAGELERRFGALAADSFSILLAHDPLFFPAYARWGADLTFAGHMHGGSIRLPGVRGGLLSPEREFFPRWSGGQYRLHGKTMIVSRGLGDSLGIRVLNPPELPIVTLRKEKNHGLFTDGGRQVCL